MQKPVTRAAKVFRGLSHPTRILILDAMRDGRTISPRNVYLDAGVPLGNASYHIRELAKLGLIRPAGTRPARGAVEHFYRLSPVGELALELARQAGR